MANISEKNIIVRMSVDTKDAQTDIDRLQKRVDGLTQSTEKAQKNLKETESDIEDVAKESKKAAKEVENLGKESVKATKKVEKGFKDVAKTAKRSTDSAKKSVTGLDTTIKGAASTFAGLLAFEGAMAVGQQLAQLSRQSVGLAISAEQTQVAFETFLGSAEKANKVLAELNQFSTLTPFEPEEVIRAGQSLLAFGVDADKITDSLTAIGNVAAGTGTDFNELAEIFGKAKTQGRLFGEDINQLTGRGIPIIGEFAKQFGVAESEVKGLVTEGRIGFPELERAFESLTGEGGKFFNLIEKQSQTVGGRISTLTGNFNALLRAIGEKLLPTVGDLVDFFNQLTTRAREFVEVPVSENLEKQRINLNLLVAQITEANISEEARLKLINQLNEEFPEFLGNLNAETVSNEQLANRLEQVNEQLINQIVLQRKLEEEQKAIQRAGEARLNLIEEREKANRRIIEANELLTEKVQLQNKTFEERARLVREEIAQGTDVIVTNTGNTIATTKRGRALIELDKSLKRVQTAQEQENRRTAEANGLTAQRIKLAEELGIVFEKETETTNENTSAKITNTEVTKKQIDAEEDLKKLREKQEASEIAIFAAFEEKKAFEDLLKEIVKNIEAREKLAATRKANAAEAERLRQSELDDEKQVNADLQTDADESIRTTFEAEEIDIETQRLNRIKNGEDTLDLDIKILQARLKTAKIGSLEFIKIQQELAEKIREAEEQQFDERIARQKLFLDSVRQGAQIALQVTKDGLEARREILDIQVAEQEKRVESATKIAVEGNAELLQAEEDRLSALNDARARNANQLQQIAAIEVAANQAVAISQGIVAVTAAFQRNFVEGIAASVALAATVASTIAAVNQAFGSIQGFAEGTPFVDGEGTSKSDSIPAMLSRGERVVPASTNAKYFDALNEFQNETPQADMMASMLNGNIPSVSRERVAPSAQNRGVEKQLQRLNDKFDALEMRVTLDKEGFSASLSKYRDNQKRSKKLIR